MVEFTHLERRNVRSAIEHEAQRLVDSYLNGSPDCPDCARRAKADTAERLSALEAAMSKIGGPPLQIEWREALSGRY